MASGFFDRHNTTGIFDVHTHSESVRVRPQFSVFGDELRICRELRGKGYRWCLMPSSGEIDPLYCKGLFDIPSVMREYPNIMFIVASVSTLAQEVEW